MPRPAAAPALACAAALALAAAPAAGADEPEPLVDRAPATTVFEDRVAGPAAASLRAAPRQSGGLPITTGDGERVTVRFIGGLDEDRAVARSYVRFLGSLPHGRELGRLTVALAPARRVGNLCGGGDGVLACYSPVSETMVVPASEIGAVDTPTTSYVVAHEYGHHVAANRDNAPFEAIDYGPKRWASYEQVCIKAIDGDLAPGDEGASYRQNPGESWAEAYARLTYPDVPWRFTRLLEPDAGALAAARQDVLDPWAGPRTRTFTMPDGATAQAFRLALRLDGALTVTATGPAGSAVGLTVHSGDEREGRARPRDATARLHWRAACRTEQVERLRLRVTRAGTAGPVALRVRYAG
ncbi:MAG TPA: hypothetical protein VIL49_10375 [Capillimicrobium sp.]|jgi:hypothetical protein